MRDSNYVREPIALFQKITENKKLSDLLHNLKSAYPEKLKIGAAIKTGDCFFDSVAQGLNELNIKPDYRFTAKSLRKDCADYARANRKPDQWVYKAVIRDAGEYFVPQKDPDGEVISENGLNKQDKAKSFFKYLEYITNTHTADAPIWGRPDIEGRMICEKYEVEFYIYSIDEESQKVTVTKITAHDDPEFFIEGENLDQLKMDNSKKTVGVVNYMRHFVPLLSEISKDITESQPVSNEEIFGEVTEVPASDQSEQEEQYNIRTSKSAIVQDHETQKERINTSASEPIHTDTVITISHQQGQETQQEAIEKKLINSCYRREAIYSIAAVITAIAFTAFATVAIFTQPIPSACLAGVALAIARVCVYQLTQSHQDINELKGKVGENNTFTFLEETGFKIYSLIDKAASKI